MKDIYEQIFSLVEKNAVIEAGLVRQDDIRPHTREVADLEYACSGALTAGYYFGGILTEKLDEQQGLELLDAISTLQVTDKNSEFYGAFRTYREEKNINDSNAAFFTLRYLVVSLLFYKNKMPQSHVNKIIEMMKLGYNWFCKECKNPALYYSNKIMSDGAMLLAISQITDCKEGIDSAVAFWKRWNEYTDRRGWGWGENTSLCYIRIILDAIYITLGALPECEGDLRSSLINKKEKLIEYIRFHNGRQPVPSIRTYNFSGKCYAPGLANMMAGVRLWTGDIEAEGKGGALSTILSIILAEKDMGNENIVFGDDPMQLSRIASELPVPRINKTRIFDDAYAYTYVGENCRLGSINKMPVIPGCYQWPTWGLGWQSIPVAFVVDGKYTGFLRFSVMENGRHRTHPAENKHTAYLSPALFGEENLPECKTFSKQENNIAVVVRKIENISNTASDIKDEWFIQNFDGQVNTEVINGKKWIIITHENCAVDMLIKRSFLWNEYLGRSNVGYKERG